MIRGLGNHALTLSQQNGDGSADYGVQLGNTVPSVLEFEGGDVINLGGNDADEHPDFVSLALGGRFSFTECCSLGVAYEVPLTETDRSLMDQRVTANLSVAF